MATKTTKYGYINIPFTFMARDKKYLKKGETPTFTSKLAVSKLLALSVVRSFSSPEREAFGFKKKKNHVKLSLSGFSGRYNVSASTSRRALASLESCEKIDKTEDGMYFSADKMKERYLSVQEWLFFATFGEDEYLTKSEVLVLSYFISFARTKGAISKSLRRVAGELGLSHTWVINAVDKLERLGLVNVIRKYHNLGKDRTVIYLASDKICEKKSETICKLYPKDAERTEYYKNVSQLKQERARAMMKKAEDLLPGISKDIRRYFDDRSLVNLKELIIERLQSINMGWYDVVIRKCRFCGDTGTMRNGEPCDCWKVGKLNK